MANNFSAKLSVEIDKQSLNNELKKIKNNTNNNQSVKVNLDLDIDSYKKKLAQLNKASITLNKIDTTGLENDVIKAVNRLKGLMKTNLSNFSIGNYNKGLIDSNDVLEAEKILTNINLIDAKIKNIRSGGLFNVSKSDMENSLFNVDKYINDNPQALKQYASQLNNLKARIKEVSNTTGLKALNKEFNTLKKEIQSSGQSGRTLSAELGNDMKKFFTWTVSSTMVMQSVNSLLKMVANVKDLDTAMTSLYKVTNETDQKYASFLQSAIANAKELGSSISDLINATADFARLGYSLDEAEILGKTATLYKNIGDGLNIGDATKSIISTLAAYKKTANEAIDVVDIFNNIGNKFAIDSKGIGDALQKSASSLNVANNSLEQSVAMITAANTIVQDPDVVGTAMKTLALRLTSTKSELEEMGEATDFACQNLSDYRDLVNALTNNKVDILGDNGDYKNTYDILKEISYVWEEMDGMSKSSLMKALFGVRQSNVGASLLENFDIAEKALKEAENSSGSAMEEQERWMTSIEGKMQKLGATFQSVSHNVINSDLFKFTIDSLNTILNLIDLVTSQTGTMGVALAGIGAYAGAKGYNFKDVSSLFKGNNENALFQTILTDVQNSEINKIWSDFDKNVKNGNMSLNDFNSTIATSDKSIISYFKNTNMATMSQQGLSNTVAVATVKQKALNIAMNMFTGLMIGAAINLTIKALDSLIVTQEELENKAVESANAYKQAQEDITNVNNKLKENAERIREIKSNGVITYTEQSELDKLERTNKQLEKQLELLKDIEVEKGYEAALDGGKALGKYVGTEISQQEYISKFNTGEWYEGAIQKENFGGQLAIYEKYQSVMESTVKNTEEWNDANDRSTEALSNLKNGVAEINTYLTDNANIYEYVSKKSEDTLTTQEKQIKYFYERYQNMAHQVDKAIDPNGFYSSEIDDIFNTKDIEVSKDKLIELARVGSLKDLDLSEFDNLSNAIEESGLDADETGSKIKSFKKEIEALSNANVESLAAMDFANGMDDTVAVFDQQKEQLNDLADLVESLGKNFTLTADEARKFAYMFPELLAQGEVMSNGLIKFNSDVVQNFIEGKELERKADAQTRIKQLEDAKAVLIGQKEKAEAELQLAQQVANGELTIEEAKVKMLSNAERQLTQYLIDLGVDEQTAEAAALAAKSGNMELYDKYVGKVANDNANNLAGAMVAAASATKENVVGMVNSLDSLGRQSANVSQQMANISTGKVTYGGKVSIGGGAKAVKDFASSSSIPKFNTTTTKKVEARDIAIDNWIESIELDISKYTTAIDAIDAQINVLKAQGNQNLDKYKSKRSSGSKKNKSKDKKDFSETFDWLNVAIERLEEKIQKLDKTASNTYKTYSVRNKALKNEIGKLTDEIALQTAAYNVYMAQANSVGLSSHYKNLVQNGALDIETITDENLAKKIKEYQKYYNAANDTSMKIVDLDKQLSDLYVQQFDNISQYWDDRISIIESQMDNIEKMIDMNEAKGMFSGKTYYESLIEIERSNIENLEKERKELMFALNEGVNNGSIAKYSETWYDLQSQINDVNTALLDANASLLDFSNDLRQLNWDIFDYGQERIESITSEAEFLLELLEKQKSFDKNGRNTQYADAKYEIFGVKYNTYMQQADKYANALKELDDQFKNDSLNKDYIERRQELLELQRESILNAESEKESIIDLIEEGYNAQLDALDKLIEKRKEEFKIQKDIYDYQKEIADKSNNISQLEKQLNAYSTDSSEENQKTIQDLKNQLAESKKDLEETEYEKYLSDQEELLDMLYTSFEEWISVRLDDVDGLISETIDSINNNSQQVSDTINQIAGNVGYELDKPLKDIINANDNNSSNMYNLVSKYDENFSNKMTAVKTSIDNIYISVSQLVKKSEEEAKKKLEDQQKQQQKQQSSTPTNNPVNSNSSSSSDKESNNNNASSGGSVSSKGSFFVHKKDSYPKSKLKITTSIVDRLKYNDFDSSFSRRKTYFEKMGLGKASSYTGSSSQNQKMVSWMIKNGFKKSGSIKNMINSVGEDGLFLGRKDDVVIARQDWDTVGKVIDKSKGIKGDSFDNSIRDIFIQMDLSGVKNYDEFVAKLKSDDNFVKYIKVMMNSSLAGKNSLRKNKYK